MKGNVGIDNCEDLLHIGHSGYGTLGHIIQVIYVQELSDISDTDGHTEHVGQVTHVDDHDCSLHLAKMIVKTGFEERIMLDTPRGISWIA